MNIFLQIRNWILKSVWLVKQSLKISIFFGMLYLSVYVIFPAIPGMQFMGLFSVFIWPFMTILIVYFYSTIETNKNFSFEKYIETIKPKISNILSVGLFSFAYAVLLSSLIGNDIVGLVEFSQNNQDHQFTLNDFSGIIFKLIVMGIPFMMMTWFAPLLIAFKQYSVIKSIKSSFAACFMFLIPLTLSLLTLAMLFLLSVFMLSAILSSLSSSGPSFISFIISFLMLIFMSIFIASTFALQSVTFKEIFK